VTHDEVEDRLLSLEKLAEADLLAGSRAERLVQAYRSRSRKAGYRAP
jgi:hypothetical protein